MPPHSIGELANLADVKPPTIRFYEQIGLMPTPRRTPSDRRVYESGAVARLAFIKHARQLGFPVEAIRTLLDLADHPERACGDANRLAQQQLAVVEEKLGLLASLQAELSRMVSAGCDGPAGECRVIESLSDHGHCLGDHGPAGPTVRS